MSALTAVREFDLMGVVALFIRRSSPSSISHSDASQERNIGLVLYWQMYPSKKLSLRGWISNIYRILNPYTDTDVVTVAQPAYG